MKYREVLKVNELYVEGYGWITEDQYQHIMYNVDPSPATMLNRITQRNIQYQLSDGKTGQMDIEEKEFWKHRIFVSSKALEEAKKTYNELKVLYDAGNENPDDYLEVLKKYAVLVNSYGCYKNGLHTEWTIPETLFMSSRGTPTYTSYKSFTRLPDFLMFAEDCAMMIYRLHGGDGFTTMSLVNLIEDSMEVTPNENS